MTDQRSRDEALVAAAVLASLYYKTDDGGVLIHDNKRILSAARWALDMNTDIKSAIAGEANAGDDECAKGNHAWRGPLLGWWRCVLCGEKTGDAGHPSKTKLAALEAENARLAHERDAWRSSSTRLAAERDALAAKVKEMEAECAQALDNATTARSAFSKMLDERDAVSDRARSLEHDLNLCESHRRRLQDQLSAIRAAAKE